MDVSGDDVIASRRRLLDSLRKQLPGAEAAVFAPGRIEVLGKHTDYCGGRSLLVATEQGIAMAGRRLHEPRLLVRDAPRGEEVSLPLHVEAAAPAGHWSNYAATVARRLARNFPELRDGAEIWIESKLPPAAGLSSSSALITGMALLLARLTRLDESQRWQALLSTRELLAGYLGTVENGQSYGRLAGDRGVGTFGGSQDHIAILCSEPGQLVQYRFAPIQREAAIALPPGLTFVVASSGIRAEKTGSAMQQYNAISLQARAIVDAWNRDSGSAAATLADVLDSAPDALPRLRALLATSPELGRRLDQHVQESRRIVPAAAQALAAGDLRQFAGLVAASQRLAEQSLGNQIPQTIALVRLAAGAGALAASAFGAGFGGSVWALVPAADAAQVARQWQAAYARAFPDEASRAGFFVTSAAAPLQWL
jgi:galactokinase